MTSEQRLDPWERIAKLFVRAGLRARQNMKQQHEKINIIINNQIGYDQRFVGLNQSLERSDNELSRSLSELAKAQVHTNQRLDSLIEVVRRDRNGNSH
jgi:hypothetical protein